MFPIFLLTLPYPPQNTERNLRIIKKPQQLLLAGSCWAIIQKPDQHFLEQMLFQLCNVQPQTVAVSKSKAVGQRKAKLYENHMKVFLISRVLSFTAYASETACELWHAAAGLASTSMTWICHQLRPTVRSQAQGCHPTGALAPDCAAGGRPCDSWAADMGQTRGSVTTCNPCQPTRKALGDIIGQAGGHYCTQPAPGSVKSFGLPVNQEPSPK